MIRQTAPGHQVMKSVPSVELHPAFKIFITDNLGIMHHLLYIYIPKACVCRDVRIRGIYSCVYQDPEIFHTQFWQTDITKQKVSSQLQWIFVCDGKCVFVCVDARYIQTEIPVNSDLICLEYQSFIAVVNKSMNSFHYRKSTYIFVILK